MLIFFDVDLVIITIAYLLVYHGDTGAGLFAFIMGILVDIFSACPLGLFPFLYLTIFLSIKHGSFFFDLLSARGQITLVTLAVLGKAVLFVTFLNLLSLEMTFTSSNILAFATSAICSGMFAPFIFNVYNFLSNALKGRLLKLSEGRKS
ncbi:MAG: hypothetical protein SV375_13405 [Thermodesulfobacteriota bacterium]|nr:hypothetical protein [Thermodesulfobacteriota bacterium]